MPYRIEHVDPSKTAMIVVDMQNDFVAEGAKLRSAQGVADGAKAGRDFELLSRQRHPREFTRTHAHRPDGCDMGMFDDLYPPIADRSSLVDGTAGVEIFKGLATAPGEHVIKKHRYSGFYGTDLDNHPPAVGHHHGHRIRDHYRELLSRNRARRAFPRLPSHFLSDATGTFDYPDVGQGAMSAEQVHKATLTILAHFNGRRDDRGRTQSAGTEWQAADHGGLAAIWSVSRLCGSRRDEAGSQNVEFRLLSIALACVAMLREG